MLEPVIGLDLVQQMVHEVHVIDAFDFGDQEAIDARAGVFDDANDVAVAPLRVDRVDADAAHLVPILKALQRVDHHAARAFLHRGRDRVLEVEEDLVGCRLVGPLVKARLGGGDGQARAAGAHQGRDSTYFFSDCKVRRMPSS